jgi:hypothetical protein
VDYFDMPAIEGLVEGSEASLVLTIYDVDGDVTDLTTALDVRFYWRIDGGSLVTKQNSVDSNPTITTAASGEVTYNPASSDWTPGSIVITPWWQDSGSKWIPCEKIYGEIQQQD